MAEINVTGPDIVLGGRYLDSGSGGGTGPKIVRFAHWLAGTQPPNDPGSPLGPGGRWRAFKAWVKKLVSKK